MKNFNVSQFGPTVSRFASYSQHIYIFIFSNIYIHINIYVLSTNAIFISSLNSRSFILSIWNWNAEPPYTNSCLNHLIPTAVWTILYQQLFEPPYTNSCLNQPYQDSSTISYAVILTKELSLSTSSDFLGLSYLQPNLVDLRCFKL